MVDEGFRRRVRHWGRDERADNLIRKSIVGREPGKTQFFWDDRVPGFGLKITAKNHESFVYQYRPEGQRYAKRITFKGVHSVAHARALASDVASGRFAEEAERPSGNPETLAEVVDSFFQLRGSAYTPQSRRGMRRSLELHVLPVLGSKPYEVITRRDLARLRDAIAVNLSTIWNKYYCDHASDDFTWPKTRSPLEAADRNGSGRSLSDGEIRQFWHATFKLPAHRGAYFRFLLLSGMRRTAAARITREQLVGNVLHIPGTSTKPPYELPLSTAALDLLHVHWSASWAFEPLGPYGPLKEALDRQIGQPFVPWTIHHLRHTCRTLLSKVATDDIAELVLGHSLKGVRRTYDHHSYMEEKLKAMEGLARLIATIVE